MINTYTEYVSKLIHSVTQKFVADEAKAILIKHYNSLDLNHEIVDKCFSDKKEIKYIYHEFDSSVMAEAYEPFLSAIKDIFYSDYNITLG